MGGSGEGELTSLRGAEQPAAGAHGWLAAAPARADGGRGEEAESAYRPDQHTQQRGGSSDGARHPCTEDFLQAPALGVVHGAWCKVRGMARGMARGAGRNARRTAWGTVWGTAQGTKWGMVWGMVQRGVRGTVHRARGGAWRDG